MKKWIIGLVMLVLCGIGIRADAAPRSIVGGTAECDLAFSGCQGSPPLSYLTLCVGGGTCPIRTSFSYTDSTRFWGATSNLSGQCRTSINGGVNWSACTTQPFAGAGGSEQYAGTGNGGVVVSSDNVGGECTIRLSTDNATSWNTVFTDTGISCVTGTNEGQYLYCLLNGRCELNVSNSSGTYITYVSLDYGVTWIKAVVTGSDLVAGNHAGVSWNGVAGIMSPVATNSLSASSWAEVFPAVVWSESAIWGSVGTCWGHLVFNSVGYAICHNGVTYQRRSAAGTVPLSFVLPGAIVAASQGGVAFQIGGGVYVIGTLLDGVSSGLFISQDNFGTFSQIGTIGFNSRGGNAFVANGCGYFTVGVSPNEIFGKVC